MTAACYAGGLQEHRKKEGSVPAVHHRRDRSFLILLSVFSTAD
jgi:hypothetical protein